jgi:CheY-like chemotaxis protein
MVRLHDRREGIDVAKLGAANGSRVENDGLSGLLQRKTRQESASTCCPKGLTDVEGRRSPIIYRHDGGAGLVPALVRQGFIAHAYDDYIATQAGRGMPSTERNECQPNAGGSPRRGKPVVVLAEDNDDARRIYSLILRHYGYEVVEVTTGSEAVQATRSLLPSLVLMDIGLPEMDGWQASRILKEDPATRGIPLIAFSARIDSTSDLTARPTFDGYILKPVSPKELARRVGAYLSFVEAH